MRNVRWTHVSILLSMIGWAAGGCGDSSKEKIQAASLSEGCLINTDCESPLVCAFRRCHDACETSRDCPAGQRCLASDRPFHVCQLADEKDCSYNSECPTGLVCAVDGECRDQCGGDRDCLPGSVCVSAACAEPEELDDNGALPTDDESTTGQSCTYNSECPSPLICRQGTCALECLQTIDCPLGSECTDNRCIPTVPAGVGGSAGGGNGSGGAAGTVDAGVPDASGPECTYNSDCTDYGPGYRCVDRSCVPECMTNADCPGSEICTDGECQFVAPDGAPPEYGEGCTLTSDCVPGLVCVGGRCVYECVTDADCELDSCCSSTHYCVTGASCPGDAGADVVDPPADAGAGGAGGAAGVACVADADCQDGLICNGAERCLNGTCRAAPRPLCDDGNSCTEDQCEEATGLCTYVPLAAQDADGDGHFAESCGGDDCDDDHPLRFGGNPEVCDGVDNNCNDVVDEGVWQLGAAQALPSFVDTDTTLYDPGRGEPPIAVLGDGTIYVAAAGYFSQETSQSTVDVWHLDANLNVLEGPVQGLLPFTGTNNNTYFAYPSLGTNGTALALGAFQRRTISGDCGSSEHAVLAAAGPDLTGLVGDDLMRVVAGCSPLAGLGNGRPASLAWNDAEFLAAWADARDGTLRAYVGSVTAAGAVGTSALVADTASSAVATNTIDVPIRMVASATHAVVVWLAADTDQPRYATLDPSNLSLVDGPRDLSDAPAGCVLGSVELTDSRLMMACEDGADTHLFEFDVDDTSTPLQTGLVTAPSGAPSMRLGAVATGWLLTARNGDIVSLGHQASDLTSEVSFTDMVRPADVSPVSVGVVDDTRAVLAWSSANQVFVAPADCE